MDRMNVTSSATCCAGALALDDMSLVHACKEGDAHAFEQLVKRHDVRLFRSLNTSPITARMRRKRFRMRF